MSSIARGPVGLVAIVILCLSGCSLLERIDTSPLDPGGVHSPASPTAPAPIPPVTSLTVTPEGLGPLAIGSPVPPPSAAPIVSWDATYCVGDATGAVEGDPFSGAWLPTGPDAMSPALGERPPFYLLTADGLRDGPVREINVWSPDIRTIEGIRAGDSREQLTATYARFDEIAEGVLSDVFALDGVNGRLLFEVARESEHPELAGYWGSAVDTVVWMRVVSVDSPASAIAASDAGGPCVL
ncbi:hypothetical protein B0I08_1068 [Glaciihabitans tibetensis]|uniref:Uncharacterized protein n=1 Tax=Glaciihabitans tibetensis TaxID=1266600 RepID=A0A2T0VB35_9MICO|nr:hypothetical protein [Glaciihabitans tibetensis]PRY67405.1 hypothetical protein B0I08_1068 [Glaciihabitans tibetensis]